VEFSWPPELEAFRLEVRSFLEEHMTPEVARESATVEAYHPTDRPEPPRPHMDALLAAMAERGWFKRSLSRELGGDGESAWYQFVLNFELRRAGIFAYAGGGLALFAPAIMRFGTEEQQQHFIPKLASGEITLALGYSEPGAGSDLAALKTRAVRDGDEYVINGQKIWTSDARNRTHVWLAVRTDQQAPKHRGISVFIVPLDSPGITIRPIWTMSGVRTNEVFYEDVRVPRSALIGEENRGWYIVANALDNERVLVGVGDHMELIAVYDRLRETLANEYPERMADPVVRRRLAELAMQIGAHRALLLTNACIVGRGEMPTMAASMVKVFGTELRQRLADSAMDLVGRRALLRREAAGLAPAKGRFEEAYLYSPVMRFAGGSKEIQRYIIAQRGLGLPR
jgi:alkylation response protein AidB-like acyl-CoA dehydrogenase